MKEKLLVTWTDRCSIYPIGALEYDNDNKFYSFYYVRAVITAREAGFAGLFSMPDFNFTYSSNFLFPVFSNRVMKRSRPDFVDYVTELGLDRDAKDMQILAASGGRKVTDPYGTIPWPNLVLLELEKLG